MEVYIVAAKRTPIGSFMGSLEGFTAVELGIYALKAALESISLPPETIEEVYVGNVLSAGLGQAPATQISLGAGIPPTTPATLINKVCASGLKAVMLAAQTIALRQADLVAAVGTESMSQAPYYLPKLRSGNKLGHLQIIDAIIKDGLEDAYSCQSMGAITELCATEYNISRQEQDDYARLSYERAQKAWREGIFAREVIPLTTKKGLVAQDEEPFKANFEKMVTLKPVFKVDGTITAANASKINDGAAAVILASAEAVKRYALTPLARIVSYADAARPPEWFTIAPSDALRKALHRAHKEIHEIDLFEINEAFSAVALANQKLLSLPMEKLNVLGGAVALGHPLGMSGARLVVTLITALQTYQKNWGAIGICNGGGGASALVVEKL